MKHTLYKIIGGVKVYIVEDDNGCPICDEIDEEDIESIPEIDSQTHKEHMQKVEEILIPRSVVNQIKDNGHSIDDLIIGMLHGDRPN